VIRGVLVPLGLGILVAHFSGYRVTDVGLFDLLAVYIVGGLHLGFIAFGVWMWNLLDLLGIPPGRPVSCPRCGSCDCRDLGFDGIALAGRVLHRHHLQQLRVTQVPNQMQETIWVSTSMPIHLTILNATARPFARGDNPKPSRTKFAGTVSHGSGTSYMCTRATLDE